MNEALNTYQGHKGIPPKNAIKTTTFTCGCVCQWRIQRLDPTPLTCPVHGAIWARSDSEEETDE